MPLPEALERLSDIESESRAMVRTAWWEKPSQTDVNQLALAVADLAKIVHEHLSRTEESLKE